MELLEYLLKDPTGLGVLAFLIAVPSLLAILTVNWAGRRSKSQDATTLSLTDVVVKLTENQTTLLQSQQDLNSKQNDLREKQLKAEQDQARAMQELVDQSKALRQLAAAQRYEIVKLGEQLTEHNTQFLDALSPIAEHAELAGENTSILLKRFNELQTSNQTVLGAVQSLCDLSAARGRNDEQVIERLDIVANSIAGQQLLLEDIKQLLDTPQPAEVEAASE